MVTVSPSVIIFPDGNNLQASALARDFARRIRFALVARQIRALLSGEEPPGVHEGDGGTEDPSRLVFHIRILFDRSPFSESAEFEYYFDTLAHHRYTHATVLAASSMFSSHFFDDRMRIRGIPADGRVLPEYRLVLHLSALHDETPWYDRQVERNILGDHIAAILSQLGPRSPDGDYHHTSGVGNEYRSCENWFDVYHQVPLIPQNTVMNCWAASAAMVVGWRDQINLETDDIAATILNNYPSVNGLLPRDVLALARAWDLVVEPPSLYSVASLRALCIDKGPLWMGQANPDLHVIVITGMYGDGSDDGSYVRINDPWPRNQGQRYALSFSALQKRYNAAQELAGLHIQVMHSGGRRRGNSSVSWYRHQETSFTV